MRATKNLDLEVQRFQEFSTEVLAPTLAEIALATTKHFKPVNHSKVTIGDTYGHSAWKCFDLLFRQITKGNATRAGESYKSAWIPNLEAINHYCFWIANTKEKTSRSLYLHLVEMGCQPVEWNRALKQWITADVAAAIRECRETLAEDGVDYDALHKALLATKAPEAV